MEISRRIPMVKERRRWEQTGFWETGRTASLADVAGKGGKEMGNFLSCVQ
jgi:hypothetical protein